MDNRTDIEIRRWKSSTIQIDKLSKLFYRSETGACGNKNIDGTSSPRHYDCFAWTHFAKLIRTKKVIKEWKYVSFSVNLDFHLLLFVSTGESFHCPFLSVCPSNSLSRTLLLSAALFPTPQYRRVHKRRWESCDGATKELLGKRGKYAEPLMMDVKRHERWDRAPSCRCPPTKALRTDRPTK